MRLIICLTYILYKVKMYIFIYIYLVGIIKENGLIIFLKENTINKVYLKNTHYSI